MAWRNWAAGSVLLLVVATAYLPVTQDGFVWDDDKYVEANPALRTSDGLRRIWFDPQVSPQYYPLVFSTFWLEYHLWGLDPTGYHLVNVLLHGCTAVLLWRVLRRLQVPGAWFAAVVFGLHPVHVESVAWITERKNVLSGLFFLAALSAYLRFALPENEAVDAKSRRRWYLAAVGLFVAALLSKTVACSLPAVMVLLLWWKRGRLTRRDWAALAPLFALGLALGLLTAWLEQHYVGAKGKEWNQSAIERCLVAGRALWFYAAKLAWPVPVIFQYSRWHIDAGCWWQYLFPLAALAVMVSLWLGRNRLGKGPLVGVLMFAGTLMPALGFFNVYWMQYSYVADHFQYLSSAALIALAGAVASTGLNAFGQMGRNAAVVGGAAIWLGLGVLTWQQASAYEDRTTLWTDTIAKNPRSWLAHNNLGTILAQEGHLEKAMDHYQAALDAKPDYLPARFNLGVACQRANKLDEAIRHYQAAIQIDPDEVKAHANLGRLLLTQGQPEAAAEHFAVVTRLLPQLAEAHAALGQALLQQGKVQPAMAQFREALGIDLQQPEAYADLGTAFALVGQKAEALEWVRRALALQPQRARFHYEMGFAFRELGNLREAEAHYERGRQLDPHWPSTANQTAWRLVIRAESGEQKVIYVLRLARQVNDATGNREPVYLDTLAAAYAAAGQFDEAQATARRALDRASAQQSPNWAQAVRDRLRLYEKHQPFRERAAAGHGPKDR
jgi:tetratricopeptide (TPR) repeat protein